MNDLRLKMNINRNSSFIKIRILQIIIKVKSNLIDICNNPHIFRPQIGMTDIENEFIE